MYPGFKQVSDFGPDEGYEDEEISYVTLDLGSVEPTLLPTSTSYRLMGLDTSTPYLQLYGTVFKGQHVSLLGTELIFTEDKDENDRSKRYIRPVATSERRIRFREVQLKPKNGTGQEKKKAKGKQKEDSSAQTQATVISKGIKKGKGIGQNEEMLGGSDDGRRTQ